MVLNEVKDNIGREYHNKCRDYETIKVDFSQLTVIGNELKMALAQK